MEEKRDQLVFTFQYVSINTAESSRIQLDDSALHSNMFLLILKCITMVITPHTTLHSNMFLLIPGTAKNTALERNFFTFQYVSINTRNQAGKRNGRHCFTFQYVSINTGSRYIELLRGHFFTFQYVSINTNGLRPGSNP